MLIYKKSSAERNANAQLFPAADISDLPKDLLRQDLPALPRVSELQAVRHYTQLSRKNFAIDTQFYPLGSCTMKYNPRAIHAAISELHWQNRHPMTEESASQGFLSCLYELQQDIATITGMQAVSLSPMAGSQGELAGVAMIRAYHQSRGDTARTEIIVPDAAHGTNPASAVMCGYKVREIPTLPSGDLDIAALDAALGPQTAGIMLTNPSTLGVFEREILVIADKVHAAGGLLYYDGANLNAILGQVRPGDMGFDVMHLNLHKTFATPHGGGGPGAGPVAAGALLKDFLPTPRVGFENDQYRWLRQEDCSQSIGRLSAFMGNAGILLRAYLYIKMLGCEGLVRVSQFATLNANYLQAKLQQAGFILAFPDRAASHEFIVTFKHEKKQYQITALDVAKRLLDHNIHAPTMYFPLLVPECFLIEPTETEDKQTLDQFVDAIIAIRDEWQQDTSIVKNAPHKQTIKRVDDVKAARELDLIYQEEE